MIGDKSIWRYTVRMSLTSEDYFHPGVKVRFLFEHDANLWGVGDEAGIVKSTTAYGPTEKMMIIHFGNKVVTASSGQFRIVEK